MARRAWVWTGFTLLAALLATGCRSTEERRNSTDFHIQAVYRNIDELEASVKKHDYSFVKAWERGVGSALGSLPDKIDLQAPANAAQLKAAAKEAVNYFAKEVMPALTTREYNEADVLKKLQHLRDLVKAVEK